MECVVAEERSKKPLLVVPESVKFERPPVPADDELALLGEDDFVVLSI